MPVLMAWMKAWLFNPGVCQTELSRIDLRIGVVTPSLARAVWPCTLPTNLTISHAAARFLEPAETAQPAVPMPFQRDPLGKDGTTWTSHLNFLPMACLNRPT